MSIQKLAGLKVNGFKDRFLLPLFADYYIFLNVEIYKDHKDNSNGAVLQVVLPATSVAMCPSRRAGERIGGSSERPAI